MWGFRLRREAAEAADKALRAGRPEPLRGGGENTPCLPVNYAKSAVNYTKSAVNNPKKPD